MVNRLVKPTKTNSFFLFGPRGSGKTYWLNHLYPQSYKIDLLNPEMESKYLLSPAELKAELLALQKNPDWILIDEIQKAPKLLDLVHMLIESHHFKFILTGSSARKLKRAQANLLAGRAFVYNLHPYSAEELGTSFHLQQALEMGLLPKIYNLEDRNDQVDYLSSYSLSYLKEEIQMEQVLRNLEPFRKFLPISAQSNAKIINYSNIAKDVGTSTVTVQSYFQILEDTWIGFLLPAYHTSLRKQQRQNPKFYLFDMGVKRALDKTLEVPLLPQTSAYGEAFEHFIVTEIYKRNDYKKKHYSLSYLRTKDDAEIDLIIDRPGIKSIMLEIKSKTNVREEDAHSLNAFLKDFPKFHGILLSQDETKKKYGKCDALPWRAALEEMGL